MDCKGEEGCLWVECKGRLWGGGICEWHAQGTCIYKAVHERCLPPGKSLQSYRPSYCNPKQGPN